ncbi:hypothetical protein C8J30_101370 [Rhodobacter viridis]|uniref:Uncharacterized protein n=1 Tax=Rhodobacter viridis TaxID=1054202 RepID=A0A318UHA7_9RHOB|nr:hypothetical protein [Rhodobacter viridis]PYF12985.1 hypothetical protein C8J30_101370 [Rhodobacter viridis]
MNDEAPPPRIVARLWAQSLPYETAARELRLAPSIIREASDADGRITYGDAVAAAVNFYTAKIDPKALEAALRPARRGPPPGLRGTPLRLRRLRTQAVKAAAPMVELIDRRLSRLAAVAAAQAADGPADARRIARQAGAFEALAAALAKRNTRAVKGLGPKEVKA